RRSPRKSPRSWAAPPRSDQTSMWEGPQGPVPTNRGASRSHNQQRHRVSEDQAMSNQGKIVQIIGAVVDVEFPRSEVPKVYDALKVAGTEITLEVQQQLGDGIVRTIALGSTDGLKRNLVATNTGNAISVPVGAGTLGRIMDVLGRPIDEAGPV